MARAAELRAGREAAAARRPGVARVPAAAGPGEPRTALQISRDSNQPGPDPSPELEQRGAKPLAPAARPLAAAAADVSGASNVLGAFIAQVTSLAQLP